MGSKPQDVTNAAGVDSVLDMAAECTNGERQTSYGPPNVDFARTAAAWSALFGWDVTPEKVAEAMIVLKISRSQTRRKRDNYVDIAGYANCADMCCLVEGKYENLG